MAASLFHLSKEKPRRYANFLTSPEPTKRHLRPITFAAQSSFGFETAASEDLELGVRRDRIRWPHDLAFRKIWYAAVIITWYLSQNTAQK